MSKKIVFEVELDVAEHVESDEAQKVVGEMVSDILQDEAYHDFTIEKKVADRRASDEEALSLLSMLDDLSEEDVQKAIDSIDVLTEDDDDE